MENEKFTKHITKWGLLIRAVLPNAPWDLVSVTDLFDTYEQALHAAHKFNIAQDIPLFLYTPVEVLLEVEVDKRIK